MRKFAKLTVCLALLAMAGTGFFYIRALGQQGEAGENVAAVVWSGIIAGVVFLLGLITLLLTTSRLDTQASDVDDEEEGEYEPYEDEYEEEDEYVR